MAADASAPAPASAPPRRAQQLPAMISTGSRPYRSHKVRACDLCRKRKSRCTVDLPGQSCLLCRIQGADCHYREDLAAPKASMLRAFTANAPDLPSSAASAAAATTTTSSSSSTTARKRKFDQISSSSAAGDPTPASRDPRAPPGAHDGEGEPEDGEAPDASRDRPGLGESMNESVHIVGPVAAEDAQVIERFMPSKRKSPDKKLPYNVYSNDPRKPVLYTTVSRRRQGLRASGFPGESQKEILEQILGPFKHDLVNIFLEKINASFPIFDETAFIEAYKSGNESSIPPSLLCQVYATSLVYWNQYRVLAPHPKPDIRYAVNLSVAALHEDFTAPGLSTLGSSLIDLTGRAVFSMTGNAISSGRNVALSHCLGLNRDPSNWRLSRAEKNHRIRIWWGVVIHDRWASYGHGVPSQISKNQYDVPLPTLDVLLPQHNPSRQRMQTAQCFIALCQLTEILGDLLPLVYNLQPKPPKETSKILRRIRADLDAWEDALPDYLRPQLHDTANLVSGSSNLHLSFLSLKMLVSRVELQEINNSESAYNAEARQYFQTECRKAAEEIVQFMRSLKKPHFQEFWMPYSAYHLTSAATLLVRCALETTDPEVARSCLSNVDILQDVLRRARSENDWDPADMCLDHCEKILSKHPVLVSDDNHHQLVAGGPHHPELNDGSAGGSAQGPGNVAAGAGAGAAGAAGANGGGGAGANGGGGGLGGGNTAAAAAAAAAQTLPETMTHNDIVDDMMSISGAFDTMDGFPFDMTGIWDISGLQDQDEGGGLTGLSGGLE
ncbi:hypothetical protein VTO42DRAFT_5476 [Malbranchea cinnamomea]